MERSRKRLVRGGSNRDIARRLVSLSIEFHTRWRGLRLLCVSWFCGPHRAAVLSEAEAAAIGPDGRIAQKRGTRPHRREEDIIHLYTTERTYDAIAQGELHALGLSRKFVLEAMVQDVISVLT